MLPSEAWHADLATAISTCSDGEAVESWGQLLGVLRKWPAATTDKKKLDSRQRQRYDTCMDTLERTTVTHSVLPAHTFQAFSTKQLAKTLADEACKASGSAPFKGAAALSALALLLDSARMTGLQSKLHDTGPVNENIPIPFSAGPELSQQLSSSGLITQLPAILAQAEQEVKALQAAVAELPKADHSSKTVFEFNSSCFADVPTLLLYVPVVLFFTPDVPNGCAVLQSPLLEFAADLLDLTNNVHSLLSNYCTGSLLGLENCTLPAGRLAVATLQCLSTCLDALPAQPAADMASLHDLAIRSTGKTVTKLSSCAKIAWRCMDAADLATQRTVTQCKRMLFTDSSAQSNMASQRESFAAAAHLATDPCALDCLFSTVLLGLNGASNQESHGGDSSYDKDSHVGASTSLDGSQCYAQYLSLLGYSKKLFSHLTAHDNSRAFTLSSCSWFASQYLQYSHMLRIAVCQRSGQQQSYRHQELHLLLSPLMLACAASLQVGHACWT